MKLFKAKAKETKEIDNAIDVRINQLQTVESVGETDEDKKDRQQEIELDAQKIENLEKLVIAREKLYGPTNNIDKNTVLKVIGSGLCVIVMLIFEKSDVIRSKFSFSMIPKPKI